MRWRSGLVVAIEASCPERGGCDDHILSDGRFHRSGLPAAPKEQVRSIGGRIASEFALKAIERGTSGAQYKRLREPLERLRSTDVRANIRAPRGKKDAHFGWISEWTDEVDRDTGESRGMSLTLSDWFYEGIVQEGGVLSIDRAYFGISGGRERWL